MIETRALVKTFGRFKALRGIDLTVPDGQWLAICGPNGAGKTTLLRVLATLARPSGGQVCIGGLRLPGDAPAVRRRVGFVSHAPLLYGDLTAEENLRFYGTMYDVSRPPARAREVLATVGMAEHGHKLVRTLSRGMAQRLSIARALLHDPPLLLFDEPYAGLDPHAVTTVEGLIRRVVGDGRTAIVTTHDLRRGLSGVERVAVLKGGRVVGEASGNALLPHRLLAWYERQVGEVS